jgi:putative ABC transport system permease protein
MMEALLQDLRYAVRALRRTPGFSVVALVTLALGIGTATAGFSLMNWVLLRPVPGVRAGGDLAVIWFGVASPQGYSPASLPDDERLAIEHGVRALGPFAGRSTSTGNVSLAGGVPERVRCEFVMPSYFETLGTRMQLGRPLAVSDDVAPAGAPVAVISDALWKRLFDGRREALGQIIFVNGIAVAVVGVGPRDFHGMDKFSTADVWLPGRSLLSVMHFRGASFAEGIYYEFVARLRPGATFTQADAQLQAATRHAAVLDPRWTERLGSFTPRLFRGVGLSPLSRDNLATTLAIVLAICGLVLVITRANVANLQLFRGAARRADSAVRIALGAGRARLVRHSLAESLVIGALGATGGLLLAMWLSGLFTGVRLVGVYQPLGAVRLDGRVLGFAIAVGMLAAVGSGLVAALGAGRTDLLGSLKEASRTVATGRPTLRAALAGLQVAVSLALVDGALLLGGTIRNLAHVDLGFDPAGVTVLSVDPRRAGYSEARARSYYIGLGERVTAVPGVAEVAMATDAPFISGMFMGRVAISGSGQAPVEVITNEVSSNYFHSLGMHLLRGQRFQGRGPIADSATSAGSVVVSAALAQRLFGDTDPIGRLIQFADRDHRGHPSQIVGVVQDSHWFGITGDPGPMTFEPLGGHGRVDRANGVMLLVSSNRPPGEVAAAVKEAALALDGTLPLQDYGSLTEAVARTYSERALLFTLVAVFSALTLALSAVGVYGLVAYGVTTRTHEFGIRMALGACARDILQTAARSATGLILGGVLGGVAGSLVVGRVVAKWLYGVKPVDPLALGGAAVLLALAVLIASYLPARRATKVDPMVALRSE